MNALCSASQRTNVVRRCHVFDEVQVNVLVPPERITQSVEHDKRVLRLKTLDSLKDKVKVVLSQERSGLTKAH